MKLTYLGTAAAEGFPAMFCNCEYCKRARESGERRNYRTRSQALINDDLLIDLPADTMAHFHQNNIRGDKIKYIMENKTEDLDMEMFIHGAVCVGYSGRCILSNYLLGRAANHGDCAQPCRWEYKLAQ